MSIDNAISAIENFQSGSLTASLATIEGEIRERKLSVIEASGFCESRGIDDAFLASALSIKKIASQINVIIHAAGILRSLESIMEPGEFVESLSLGAGNTGRKFDLETNLRVAEYKFIDWQGRADTIRQNSIFKDFFELAEYETTKKKFLYVVGLEHPLRFFRGGRALTSVLSRQPVILQRLNATYGEDITHVRNYYDLKKEEVEICDIAPHIGRLVQT